MIRTQRPHLGLGTYTHPGLSGKTNEDRLAVASFQGASGRPVLFVVVSDGIGGHQAGEVAAALTVKTVVEHVAGSDGAEPVRIMEAAIHAASHAIFQQAAARMDQTGMGSTCACAWIEGDRLYTAYVGDSRIYLVREGRLIRTSVDHTWIQEALEKGIITPDEVLGNLNAHVLRRHLGGVEPPLVDTRLRLSSTENDARARANQGLPLRSADIVLLCSDGLTDMVRDEEILQVITERHGLKSAAEALVNCANENGGRDNTTVVLIGRPRPMVRTTSKRGVLSTFPGR